MRSDYFDMINQNPKIQCTHLGHGMISVISQQCEERFSDKFSIAIGPHIPILFIDSNDTEQINDSLIIQVQMVSTRNLVQKPIFTRRKIFLAG
jgi:hypothetical protein